MNSPFPFFSELTDPRVERTKVHMLEDILFPSSAGRRVGMTWRTSARPSRSGSALSSAFREASLPMTRLTACSPPSIPKNWNPLSLLGPVLLRN